MVVVVDDIFYHSAAENLVGQFIDLHPEYRGKRFRVYQASGHIDIMGDGLLNVTINTKLLKSGKLYGTAENSTGEKEHLTSVDCYNLIKRNEDLNTAVKRVFA